MVCDTQTLWCGPTGTGMVGAGAGELVMGPVSVWNDEKVLETVVEKAAQQCESARCPRTVHLKAG